MGSAIDGGRSGAADAPRQQPTEHEDSGPGFLGSKDFTEAGTPIWQSVDPDPPPWEPEETGVVSSDVEPCVHGQELSGLSKIERQSVIDSVDGFVEFAERRLLSLAADHLIPVIGGRIVDLAFEIQDVMTSVRALDSDDSVLEAPLPSLIPGFDLTLEIPLASGEDGHATPPLALCVAPSTPSLIGGWALDAPEQDDHPESDHESGHGVERLPDDVEEELQSELEKRKAVSRDRGTMDTAEQPEFRLTNRPAASCVVETDLESLPLSRRRKLRALELYVLAREYAPQLRNNLLVGRFEVLVIADRQQRCGLWICRSAEII